MSDTRRAIQILCASFVALSYRGWVFASLVMLVLIALAPWKDAS